MLSKRIDEALLPIYKQRVPAVVLKAINIGLSVVPPVLTGILINDLGYRSSRNTLILIGLIALALLVSFIFDWWQDYNWHKMEFIGTGLIRSYIFKNVIRKDYKFLKEHNVGEIESKVIHDAEIYAHSKISSIPMLGLNILHISIILAISFWLHIIITFSIISFAAVFFFVYSFINKKIRQTARNERDGYSNMVTQANETLAGANTVQLHGEENYFAGMFKETVDKYEFLLIKLRKWKGLSQTATVKLVAFLPLLAVFVGLSIYGDYIIGVGAIVALYMLLPYLAEPIKSLTEFNVDYQNARAVEKRLEELLTEEYAKNPELEHVQKITSLEFDNLCYKYENGKEVLWDVNFKVKSGDSLAVVGRSGTGKTTFLRMLKRQLDPSWGHILINGTNYLKVDEKSYIDRIAVLTQEVFIFDASIRDNIRFGKDLSDEEIAKFAKLSALGRMDLDTNAKDLSGGERQRMGLARALACEYDILILDEPTTELDADTEAKIIENLKAIQKETNCIFIIITHSENVIDQLCTETLELKRKRKRQ